MSTSFLSQEYLEKLFNMELLTYRTNPNHTNDNANGSFSRATALFLLVMEERCKGDGALIEKIKEHFASATAPEQAPSFDAICLWNYCPYSASIALAKITPHIWDALGEQLQERLNFTMEMYAYLESFATSDYNSYSTGPGLTGNYHKNWNPNYRLANVPVILFATHFFGDGDMKVGTQKVNDMLHAYNEEKYEQMVSRLTQYGWDRALAVWCAPAMQHEDGTYGTDAKTVTLYGGPTYALDFTHSYVKKEVGEGLGVTNGGNDYLYYGHPLDEAGLIVEHLLRFNYSGGVVKSDHHFDVNKDGEDELIAWILDRSISPYQGQMGMMKEFASGNRSSTGYCSHDFQLTTILILASKALGFYDVKENEELWSIVKVGNGDFLYKNEIGYQGFATGSYGTSTKTHSEENEGSAYFALKYVWKNVLNP